MYISANSLINVNNWYKTERKILTAFFPGAM